MLVVVKGLSEFQYIARNRCRVLVHRLGRRENPRSQIESLLELLDEPVERAKRKRLLKLLPKVMTSPEHERPKLRMPQGAIGKAVVTVMTEAKAPMTIKEIQKLVEQRLKQPVSYDTVSSFLSTSAKKHKETGIHRMRKGVYLLMPSRRTP